jgi:dolichol-phosphate mannosyltransferase
VSAYQPAEPSIVLVPTYNEAENIEACVLRVHEAIGADVLIIDDGSPDGTGEIADALAARFARVSVMHRERKMGLAGAYYDGFSTALGAGYAHVFQMDADGSHDPAALPLMAERLREADLVIGSRYVAGGGVRNWSRLRLGISRAGSIYSRTLLRLPVADTTSGFKGWRAELLRAVGGGSLSINGYVFQVEMTYRAMRAGARIAEVPITFADREEGQSKFSSSILVEAMWRVAALGASRVLGREPKLEPWAPEPALEQSGEREAA